MKVEAYQRALDSHDHPSYHWCSQPPALFVHCVVLLPFGFQLQSIGVIVAGLLIWYDPRWKWADPIVTLIFVGLVSSV